MRRSSDLIDRAADRVLFRSRALRPAQNLDAADVEQVEPREVATAHRTAGDIGTVAIEPDARVAIGGTRGRRSADRDLRRDGRVQIVEANAWLIGEEFAAARGAAAIGEQRDI